MHNNSTIIYFAILVGLVMSAFFYGLCCGKQESASNNNVNATIQGINGKVNATGSNIVNAKEQVSNAQVAIEKANGAIRDSRESARDIQAGIEECERLTDQCLEHNRAAQAILNRIGESNRAGAQESKAD